MEGGRGGREGGREGGVAGPYLPQRVILARICFVVFGPRSTRGTIERREGGIEGGREGRREGGRTYLKG